jgi:hypothetical protein
VTEYKFRIGQLVYFHPKGTGQSRAPGPYQITKRLPAREDGDSVRDQERSRRPQSDRKREGVDARLILCRAAAKKPVLYSTSLASQSDEPTLPAITSAELIGASSSAS